jgi:hypothetical protein
MERKKRSHLQQFDKFCFQKPENLLTKRKDPLSERRAPLSERRAPLSTRKLQCTAGAARIYACNRRRFANLPKMTNPDTKLLEKYFSYFTKNFRMPNLYVLEMLTRNRNWNRPKLYWTGRIVSLICNEWLVHYLPLVSLFLAASSNKFKCASLSLVLSGPTNSLQLELSPQCSRSCQRLGIWVNLGIF